MAGPNASPAKPFTAKTVESQQSVVTDQLKPTAEMHILVGGPYKDPVGEEHRYGHTALRIKTQKSDLTYDFGRYALTSGTFGENGEGILRVWSNFQAYIKGEIALQRKTTGFVYAIFDHQADMVNKYFDDMVKTATYQPGRSSTGKKQYKLQIDYHALGPNCTTLSIDGAKQAIAKIDEGSEAHNKPAEVLTMTERLGLAAVGGSSRLFLPANLLHFLTDQKQVKPVRTDIYGNGK